MLSWELCEKEQMFAKRREYTPHENMIQVDVGDQPPISLGPPQLSFSVFQFP